MTGDRPATIVGVVGTGTEVGKTWVTARLAERLRAAGHGVAARKPAQSFASGDATTDASELAAATGATPEEVCPPHRWYPVPVAPPMAARRLDRPPVRLAELVAEIAWPSPAVEFGLVETAGGVRSPQAEDGDAVDLLDALVPDRVLLVADAGLGTLHLVRLCAAVLPADRLVVHLNRFDAGDGLHAENHTWLVEREGLEVTTDIDGLVTALATGPR